ncbi:hypothetical protein HBH43_010590 [Parastagonospora nodorum]|nr:hypothetical protein HBH43_010590 [Parastagonospora nodorum]
MVFTSAQAERTALGEPIYIAPPARRQRRVGLRTNINDLPDELLVLMIEGLDNLTEGKPMVHALTLVNRRFNRLSVPFLYSWFAITYEDDMQIFAKFLHTTLDAPQLVCFTKSIFWQREEERLHLSDTSSLHLSDISKAIDFVHTLKVPFTQQWVRDILHGCGDALLAVQICLMPQLVEFHAESEFLSAGKRLPAYLRHLLHVARGLPFSSGHSFKHLSHVRIPYCSLRPCDISAIFNLHSLETLFLAGDESREDDFQKACLAWSKDKDAWECAAHSSTIKRLGLSGALPAEAVGAMIKSCSSLLNFYFCGDIWLSKESGWYRVVDAALRSQSGSLERLSFDAMMLGRNPPQANSIAGHFSQLASFPVLDTYAGLLAMILSPADVARPNQLLNLVKTLPPTIEHLMLEVSPDWDPCLLLDPEDKSLHKALPQIKRLYIRYPMLTLDNLPYKLLDVANFFIDSPIQFSFILDFRYKRMNLRPQGAELAERADYGFDDEAAVWPDIYGWDHD